MSTAKRHLQLANRVRAERSQLKRQLRERRIHLAQVLLHPPPFARSWPVGRLLIAAPSMGETKARIVLSRAQVPESKPVGDLTPRQRHAILDVMRRENPHMWRRWSTA